MDIDKVVGRIESMLFNVSGCNLVESEIVLKECLSKIRNNPNYERDLGLFAKHIKSLKNSANYVDKGYIKQLKPFIDSQIIKADEFYKELSKTEEGRKKIIEIKRI